MKNYPTKEDILKFPQITTSFDKRIIKTWKKNYFFNWNKLQEKQKNLLLKKLIKNYAKRYHKKINIKMGNEAMYDPNEKTIYLNSNSIITTLHEVAHALFGTSELVACTWSTQLYKQTFPSNYKKLKWKGHLLTTK